MTASDLAPLFRPASVAVVGASDDRSRIGGRVFRNLVAHGYRGRLIPVSRRATRVQGVQALPGVEALNEPVDLAILAVNATQTLEVLKRILDQGTRHVLSFAAGADATAIASVLKDYDDAAFVGPNSNGIWSVEHHLIASFGSEAELERILPGPVAVVTHSGSLGGAVARRLQSEGIGTGYLVSAGNEVDLSLVDYVEFFLSDPHIRVIGVYLEGVTDGERLRRVLYRAKDQGVAVVAFVAGQSTRARQATASHTGKAVSSPALYRAVLEECGVTLVSSVDSLSRACRAATAGFGPKLPTVGAVGISGGMLAIIADSCDGAGLPFAELRTGTTDVLERNLPGFSTAGNPVDLTGAVLEREGLLPDCARAVAEDPGVDALVVGLDNRGYERIVTGTWIEPLARAVGKPVALVLWDQPPQRRPELERDLLASGVAVITDPSDTARTLRWMCRADHCDAGDDTTAQPMAGHRVSQAELQTWAGQAALAGALGLQTPSTVVATATPVVEDFAVLTPPLVVKALPNRIQHKTDRGMVITGLPDPEAAVQATRQLQARLPHDVPVIVQEQVAGVEVLLSMSRDVDWGPVVTIGIGGAMVELIAEVATLPAPTPGRRVERALRRGRLWPLLSGFRGRPPADVDALLETVARLQHTFLSSELDEFELNPVMVAPRGEGAFMVDLLTTQSEPQP